MAHIGVEKEVTKKRGSVGPTRPRGTGHPQPMRVHEGTTEKKPPARRAPYELRKHQTRERTRDSAPTRLNFIIDLKELVVINNVVNKLKSPPKIDKILGPSKETWYKFHKAFDHNLHNCLALEDQLDELVRDGFLKEYLEENREALTLVAPTGYQGHEVPVHGEVNTISGGFLGEGCTTSQ